MSAASSRTFSLVRLAGSAILLLASGCKILPEASLDPTRFYLLKSTAATGAASAANAGAAAVRLRPVELADYLRTRALVVRRDDNEVDFRDFARWGEALGAGIARVLSAELAARGAPVATGGIKAGPADQKIELRVRVLTCEGVADGAVRFHATWELHAIGGVAARNGDYQPTTLRWDGRNETTLAAALSEAIAGLAAEIAPAMVKK
ncbi:MAG: PqiC family protein [Opitutaceae bacterium]